MQTFDYFLREQPRSPLHAGEIVIVGITEADIRALDTYPVPTGALADALEAISAHEPAAVVLDLYRDLPIPGTTREDEERLARCFTEHPNVLGIRRLGLGGSPEVPPAPFLAGRLEQAGFNDFSVDYRVDETARRMLVCMDDGRDLHFSISLLAALLYLQSHDIDLEQDPLQPARFRLGRSTLVPFESNDGPYIHADAAGLQMLLDFRGPTQFRTYRFTEARRGLLPPGSLEGKIVLIGLMADSVKDHVSTPLAKRFPGVLLHAQAIHQLLRQALDGERPLRVWPEWRDALWLLGWCALGSLLGFTIRAPFAFAALVVTGLAALTITYWAALTHGLWLLVVAPATGFGVAAAIGTAHQAYREKRERELLMQLFSKHVSTHVAREIWRQREHFMAGLRPIPQVITGTVFFSDLKGFAVTAEAMSPDELLAWLNEYMESMAAAIEDHGGLVIRYMGDAIMAAFGAPVPRATAAEISRDAANAVRCTLAMAQRLEALNESWAARDLPTTQMRIGMATGPLVSGSIGGAQRLEYTVTGDTVVTAKRLESARRDEAELPRPTDSTRILISHSTAALLDSGFLLREIGALSLDGKNELVTAHAVLGESQAARS